MDTVEVYDPATDSWSTKSPMPTARHSLAGAVLDGKFYAVGGHGSGTGRELEVYDPTTDLWSVGAPMLTAARNDLAAAFVGTKLFAAGGGVSTGGGGNPVPFVEQFAANDTAGLIVLVSGPTTLAAGLGSGSPSAAIFTRLDAGDVSGLAFQSVQVGAFGGNVAIPPGAPAGTVVVNIPPANGQNGFFKANFVLPAGFTGCQISCGATMDYYGRAFVNSHPFSPSLSAPGRITGSGNSGPTVHFSTANPEFFHEGSNEVVFAVANADGGGSGGAFYCFVTYRVAAALHPLSGLAGDPFHFTVTGETGAKYRIEAAPGFSESPAWTILGTNTATGGSFPYTDPAAPGFVDRFYRAVRIP